MPAEAGDRAEHGPAAEAVLLGLLQQPLGQQHAGVFRAQMAIEGQVHAMLQVFLIHAASPD